MTLALAKLLTTFVTLCHSSRSKHDVEAVQLKVKVHKSRIGQRLRAANPDADALDGGVGERAAYASEDKDDDVFHALRDRASVVDLGFYVHDPRRPDFPILLSLEDEEDEQLNLKARVPRLARTEAELNAKVARLSGGMNGVPFYSADERDFSGGEGKILPTLEEHMNRCGLLQFDEDIDGKRVALAVDEFRNANVVPVAFPHNPLKVAPLIAYSRQRDLYSSGIDIVLGGSSLYLFASMGLDTKAKASDEADSQRYFVQKVDLPEPMSPANADGDSDRDRVTASASQSDVMEAESSPKKKKSVLVLFKKPAPNRRPDGSGRLCDSDPVMQNYNTLGFQMERFVTATSADGSDEERRTNGGILEANDGLLLEHMQLMDIRALAGAPAADEHTRSETKSIIRVLFNAEADAIDAVGKDQQPVEVKNNDLENLGMKEALQMLSSGAKTLVTSRVEHRFDGNMVRFWQHGALQEPLHVKRGPPKKYLTGLQVTEVGKLFRTLPRNGVGERPSGASVTVSGAGGGTDKGKGKAKGSGGKASGSGKGRGRGGHVHGMGKGAGRGGKGRGSGGQFNTMHISVEDAVARIRRALTRIKSYNFSLEPNGSLFEIIFDKPGESEMFTMSKRPKLFDEKQRQSLGLLEAEQMDEALSNSHTQSHGALRADADVGQKSKSPSKSNPSSNQAYASNGGNFTLVQALESRARDTFTSRAH